MGTTLLHRPARIPVPETSDKPIQVAAPPTLPDGGGGHMNMAMVLMPMMSGSGGLMMALTNFNRPLFAAAGLLMLVASIGLGVVMWISMRIGPKKRLREQRERYLDYLDDMRTVLRRASRAQQRSNELKYPHPALLG
ncbi:MAG: type VII secretion protein EccC, partial [Stackebrandtia sp.]